VHASKGLELVGGLLPQTISTSRRIELLVLGQAQEESWLSKQGWTPPLSPHEWASGLAL
jgi:hypothetical protein